MAPGTMGITVNQLVYPMGLHDPLHPCRVAYQYALSKEDSIAATGGGK